MSNRIFKNYQVNVGIPFPVRTPISFETIKKLHEPLEEILNGEEEKVEFEITSEELLKNAVEEAETILQEAQLEAVRLLEQAGKEAVAKKEAIKQQALQQGYEEGLNAAKQECQDMLQESEMIREHTKAEYREVLAGIESDAVGLILDIARKVIGMEMSFNPEDILYLVKQAFDKCSNKENIIIRVSPEDYEVVTEKRERLLSMVEGLGELEIKKDPALKKGACVLDTPFGSIDAGMQTKLDKIEETFKQLIGK